MQFGIRSLVTVTIATLLASTIGLGVHTVRAQGIGRFGPKPVIQCRQDGAYTAPGYNLFAFTAADCGGTLPGPEYVAVLSRVNIAGGVIDFAAYSQADRPAGPAVYAWAQTGTAGHSIVATYILANPVTPITPLP
jgi:hypothetical protein